MSLYTPLPCTQSIKTPPSPPTPYRSPLQAPRALEPIPEREQHCPLERHWSQMESWWKEAPAEAEQKRRSLWRRGRSASTSSISSKSSSSSQWSQPSCQSEVDSDDVSQKGPRCRKGGWKTWGWSWGGVSIDAGRRARA